MEVDSSTTSQNNNYTSGMTNMTPDDYQNIFWTMLRDAIDQMLTHPPGSYKPISYEQMYSAVYKCVCKQYSEQLYADLMTHIRSRLGQWSSHLNTVVDTDFISEFHKALIQYFHALGGIVPIFTYMNRFYIETKLHTDLKTELMKVFSSLVSDQHIRRLLPLLSEAKSRPFAIAPAVMSTMCKHLYHLNPEYAQLEPKLFSSFLPNILPPMTEEDIQAQMEADRLLQETLRAEGWHNEDQSQGRKRLNEDLGSVPGPGGRG